MKNKFTPGPWEWSERSEVSQPPSSISSIPFSIHKIAGISAVMPIADIINFPPASQSQTDELRANAKLIAAAPELFEVIKWLHDIIGTANDGGNAWCALREQPGAIEWAQKMEQAIKKVTE